MKELVFPSRPDNYRDFVKQIFAGDGVSFFFPPSRDTWWVIHELCPIYILIDSTTGEMGRGVVIFQFTGMAREFCASSVLANQYPRPDR